MENGWVDTNMISTPQKTAACPKRFFWETFFSPMDCVRTESMMLYSNGKIIAGFFPKPKFYL